MSITPLEVVYFDMDGVLADFQAQFMAWSDNLCPRTLPYSIVQKHLDGYITKGFFQVLPVITQGIDDLCHVYHQGFQVEILSSTGTCQSDVVAKQKYLWLKKNVFPILGHEIPTHLVNESPKKSKYAHPKALLVDDREKSTIPFSRAGGLTYLYRPDGHFEKFLKSYRPA